MESIIPLLGCKHPDATLDFYEALGFEITYRQDKPYVYAAIQRGNINLHFIKGKNTGTCLIHVPAVGDYHRAFADGLRAKYGRIPTANFPRIARLRPGQTRFTLFDPNGNELMFINQNEPDIDYEIYSQRNLSPFLKALESAAFLRDTYTDDPAAAKLLDKKLAQNPSAAPIDRARVLAARAELAVALGDDARLQALRDELNQMPLSDEDRRQFHDELHAADRLERWLTQADAEEHSTKPD
ncbi:MAG: hypothetical protein CL610_26020 [Anaerolineaceae bacterium]|nr:hypothetical protein [Anaerolineaceae bacterium]